MMNSDNVKILSVVGARPQFIKAATISRALQNESGVKEVLVHTGQHYDDNMSHVFFDELEISEPQYNLGIGSATHGVQTGRMLKAVEKVLIKEKPDWVLVYGDTNSTLAGALAAVKLKIPTAHVEAGLRSFNRDMPEEINRVLTDHASDILFAPTAAAVDNLLKEGIPEKRIHFVGDVMYDAALIYSKKAEYTSKILEHLNIKSKNYILATIHRAENTDNLLRLKAIFKGLMEVSKEISVVIPIHPRTKKAIESIRLLSKVENILKIIPPVGYLDMIMLEKHSRLIATDSGGVQKEAFFYRVPCVILRDETEWVELVELAWNYLQPPESALAVARKIRQVLTTLRRVEINPYGDGNTAYKIVEILLKN